MFNPARALCFAAVLGLVPLSASRAAAQSTDADAARARLADRLAPFARATGAEFLGEILRPAAEADAEGSHRVPPLGDMVTTRSFVLAIDDPGVALQRGENPADPEADAAPEAWLAPVTLLLRAPDAMGPYRSDDEFVRLAPPPASTLPEAAAAWDAPAGLSRPLAASLTTAPLMHRAVRLAGAVLLNAGDLRESPVRDADGDVLGTRYASDSARVLLEFDNTGRPRTAALAAGDGAVLISAMGRPATPGAANGYSQLMAARDARWDTLVPAAEADDAGGALAGTGFIQAEPGPWWRVQRSRPTPLSTQRYLAARDSAAANPDIPAGAAAAAQEPDPGELLADEEGYTTPEPAVPWRVIIIGAFGVLTVVAGVLVIVRRAGT